MNSTLTQFQCQCNKIYCYFICIIFNSEKKNISFLRATHNRSLLFQTQNVQILLGCRWRHFRCDPTITMSTTMHKALFFPFCKKKKKKKKHLFFFPSVAKQQFKVSPSSHSSLEEARYSWKTLMFSSLCRSRSCCRYHVPAQTCWQAQVLSAQHINFIDSPMLTIIQPLTYLLL